MAGIGSLGLDLRGRVERRKGEKMDGGEQGQFCNLFVDLLRLTANGVQMCVRDGSIRRDPFYPILRRVVPG